MKILFYGLTLWVGVITLTNYVHSKLYPDLGVCLEHKVVSQYYSDGTWVELSRCVRYETR